VTAGWLLLLIVFMPDRSMATNLIAVPNGELCVKIGEVFVKGEPRDPVDGTLLTAGRRAWSCIHVEAPGVGA
jgi:hypothetical protein